MIGMQAAGGGGYGPPGERPLERSRAISTTATSARPGRANIMASWSSTT